MSRHGIASPHPISPPPPHTPHPPQPYRQDADFSYLTGMQQHGVAVVVGQGRGAADEDPRFVLFIPDADREVGGAGLSAGWAWRGWGR